MTIKNIPFFEYPRLWTDDREDLLRIIDETALIGGFIQQQAVIDFEKSLAEYTGANYSVGVANATDGMEIFLEAIGLEAGDEVIISSHTMLATASAIKVARGIPVPVDIGDDNLIDPEAIIEAITPRTVGIMPTQLNGRTCNMDAICKIADEMGLFIVEDAAQALGSKFKGRSAGTFGLASDISFFPAKVLGCLGDAGAVLVNDEDLYNQIYQIHDHGRDVDGNVRRWGRNSRLDNLQAAILNHKLTTYDQVIERRREIASMYDERLSNMSELILPPPPLENGDHFDVFQNYELQAELRDDLQLYLRKNGIGTLIQWGGTAIHQFKLLGFDQHVPKTEQFFKRCIMLPMNVFIDNDDIEYICDKVIEFYRK